MVQNRWLWLAISIILVAQPTNARLSSSVTLQNGDVYVFVPQHGPKVLYLSPGQVRKVGQVCTTERSGWLRQREVCRWDKTIRATPIGLFVDDGGFTTTTSMRLREFSALVAILCVLLGLAASFRYGVSQTILCTLLGGVAIIGLFFGELLLPEPVWERDTFDRSLIPLGVALLLFPGEMLLLVNDRVTQYRWVIGTGLLCLLVYCIGHPTP